MALTGSMTAACWVGLLVVLGLVFTAMTAYRPGGTCASGERLILLFERINLLIERRKKIPCKREFN